MHKINIYFLYLKYFIKFRKYLKNGCFYYNNGCFQNKVKSKIFIINFSFKKKSKQNSMKIKIGKWSNKTLIFFDNFIFNDMSHFGRSFFERFISNFQKLQYKKMLIYNVNFKHCTFFSSLVKGNHPSNKNQLDLFLVTLLENALASDKYFCNFDYCNENNIISYYQQRDCAPANVIVDQNNDFVFIDLDLVDLYPALFDFLRALTIIYPQESLSLYKSEKYDCYFSKILNDSDLKKQKDFYLSIFIIYMQRFWLKLLNEKKYSTLKGVASFLEKFNPEDFPITSKYIDADLLEYFKN